MLFAVRKVSDFSFSLLRASKKFLVNLAVVSLLLEQFIFAVASTAYAADLPITPDGSTNTQIDRAANNVPIVNIAAPNAGGISHNKYNDYNVNQSGLILNNAIGSQNGVNQTQIGGLINDNANLKNSGAASIILNEVTSNNISQINGYTEIAGKKADLVLANPNGFVMNGAGFVNVSRFSAVVGSSNQFNPNPNDLTFRLSDNAYAVTHRFLPKLTIMGSGVDLEDITSTDLVANVMNIVAPIYGGSNDVNLRTGDQTFNYLTKAVTSDNSTPGSNLPDEVAIDASALGKIQAGRIFIIATKEGFGIKYSGDLLASRSGVTIDNQGNIDYNNIASEVGDILVASQKGSITQSGISQTKDSGSDIKLNAFGNITNSGQFLSTKNINIDSGATFRNDSAALNLSDNDFTIDAVDFINLGQIAANRDLDITATNQITNSAKLVGGRNLKLTAPQITNDDSIYAGNKITVTATDYLTNNKDIISLGLGLVEAEDGIISGNADDGIEITAKTLNNNKQIAANNNITINSNILNNNTADSLILGLNNVNLNAVTIDNSSANIQAASTLTLRNLTLNSPTIASSFGVTSQATTITNTSGTFYAGTLLDFDLGNADYTIIGSLESAGNTKIKAVNITNKTNLQANGAIEITATDKFTNGVFSGDNSNNKIIGGTNLSITAANLLSNYGTLSSSTNLTLTSTNNNINNNINAEIIGGVGILSLSAKNGTVNQNSLHSLVSSGDLTLDVTDFDNTGRVDIAGDFTLNVANNLTNEAGALIYSGGNMELNVVNNLTNNSGAVIYSEGDLTIQKYALTNPLYNSANNKSNLVNNISGQIISYGGNMRIDATTFTNERAIDPFNSLLDPQTAEIAMYYTNSKPSHYYEYNWVHNNDGCWGNWCNEKYSGEYAKQLTNAGSIASYIQSGGTLTVNTGTLNNLASNITAVGNITINANTLNNHSINDPGLYSFVATHTGPDDYIRIVSLGVTTILRNGVGQGAHSGPYLNPTNFAQNNPSTIKSGGSITLNVTNDISNASTNANSATDKIATQTPSLTNALSVTDITTNGTVNIDLTNYFNGPDNNGLFTKNPNPNGPLFETRSEFLDQSKFFGSDYFYTRIGLNLTDLQTNLEQQNKRMIGDQFFQNKIIAEQLSTISKNSFLLSSSETNVNDEIKSLLNNAADEYTRLGLTTNAPLTKTQINSLQKDIVWFETQTIDGATYIVPKIYLSQAARDNLKNNITTAATIYAAGDVNINSSAGKITNAGSITGNNVALSSSGDILNKNFSNITALNSFSLTSSSGSINNFSQLKAGGALSLSAAKDVTNSSTVLTNDSNLLASGISGYVSNGIASSNTGYIQSKTLETAGITGGSITINAGNDFNNYAAKITSTKNTLADSSTTSGNLSITAGDDITIDTLQLRNRTQTSWGHASKGGSTTTDTTTNVGSEISSAGSITLTTTGLGTNNEKATVDTKYAAAQTTYNSNLATYNQAVADYPAKLAAYNDALAAYNAAKSAGGFKARLAKEPTVPEVPVAPTVPVYSQIMASVDNGGSDIKIVGSNVSATGNLTLASKDEVNIISAEDSYSKTETSNKKGLTFSSSSTSIKSSTTNVSSNINAGGNVMISSGGDTNILASNISGESNGTIVAGSYIDYDPTSSTYGQTIINNDAQVNVLNGKDISYTFSETIKTKTEFNAVNVVVAAAAIGGAFFTGGASLALLGTVGSYSLTGAVEHNKQSTTKGSTTETVIKSNLNFKNDLTIASASDLTVKSSNLATEEGDISLTSGANINILADSENNSSYQYGSTNGLFGSNKKQKTDVTNTTNVSSVIAAGTDQTSSDGNLDLISVENTALQAAKLNANKDISITVGDNLTLLVATNSSSVSYTNNDETTFNFTNGSSGFFKTEIINNEILAGANSSSGGSAGNLAINVGGGILAQYNSKSGEVAATPTEGINDSTLTRDFSATPELAYINALNPTQTQYQSLDEIAQSWDQTTRGLNENGQLVIAAAAVAVAIGTGGIGSGISGAMMTAVATTAATTATISATNASMNADGNLVGSLDDVGKTALKDTTSKESIKNYAIAAAVAGAAAWAVQASGGTTSLEKGKDYAVYKPDPNEMLVNPKYRAFVDANYPNYNGVIDPSANNIGMANTTINTSQIGSPVPSYSTNPFTTNFWQGFGKESGFISNSANQAGGMNSMSLMHDPWAGSTVIKNIPLGTQLSIPPAIVVQYCATFPGACGAIVSGSMNNNFGTGK